jgi:hypothetical protein
MEEGEKPSSINIPTNGMVPYAVIHIEIFVG